jgi:amidase
MERRDFIQAALAAGAHTALPCRAAGPDLQQAAVADLRSRIDEGSLDAATLTAACLERIKALDQDGPRLRALITLNPEAGAIAAALDGRRRGGEPLGALHGIPVVLKDNIATGDSMPTTVGSLALDGVRCSRDAALVQRLRAAGAVILGKSNLSEWCNARSSNSIAGWSAKGGLTRNPYALDRVCGGSSSGSAAAVAAGLAPLAIGTETDGSIVCPASICGIVGVKPTVGWSSLAGVLAISDAQDAAGPLARSVHDAALLLDAMASAPQARPVAAQLHSGSLRGKRLGIATEYLVRDTATRAVFAQSLAVLKARGATLVEVRIPNRDRYGESGGQLMMQGLKANLQAWLAEYFVEPPVRNLADVIAFNKANAAREMPQFGQEVLEQIESRALMSAAAVQRARATLQRYAAVEGIDAALQADRLDALIGTTSIPGWPSDPARRPRPDSGFTSPAASAGYPHVTVPAGHVGLLPVGLSFVGTAWSEAELMAMAYDFEQATQARRPPRFMPVQA